MASLEVSDVGGWQWCSLAFASRLVRGLGLFSAIASALISTAALGQTVPVEYDPIRSYNSPGVDLAPPNLLPDAADPTPLDGPLRGLVFLGPKDAVHGPGATATGIETRLVPILDDPAFQARLRPHLGQPISFLLIAKIEAEVANWAREKGMPFVSISTPEQEITGGFLQFRVLEFRVGARAAIATGRMSAEQALAGIRVQSGGKINSDTLAEDIDWLSRSPFRDVTAEFRPGDTLGETDMTLSVTESKPWMITAGFDNSGSQSTGRYRFRSSVTVGDIVTPGSVLTYQFAASPDAVTKGIAPFGGHAAYQSHSVSATIPTMPRQAFEATFTSLESNILSSPFEVRSGIVKGALGYRMAASELGMPAGWGDVYTGIELSQATLETRFSGTLVASNSALIAQFYAGWSGNFNDDHGSTGITAEVRFSPGGLGGSNTGAAFSTYTSGRVTNARYAYATLGINRTTDLTDTATLENAVFAQLGTGALIDTEQMSMGGTSGVRGYLPDDGAFDAGTIARNTLYFGPFDIGSGNSVAPFVLADLGFGHSVATSSSQGFASAGAGFNFQLGGRLSGGVYGAVALVNGPVTKAGNVSVSFHVRGQY